MTDIHMSNYLHWKEEIVDDLSGNNINAMYHRGFVFGRPKEGFMQQTRSVRIDLEKFEMSSENRRILRKTEKLRLKIEDLPYGEYHWSIGKLAKDFYETKFGDGTFSANKVRELLTGNRRDFNRLFVYTLSSRGAEGDVVIPTDQIPDDEIATLPSVARNDSITMGYCIAVETNDIIHYSYPFYNQNSKFEIRNLGMGMMVRAVEYAKNSGKKYIYLGTFQRPTDTYKLQFAGMEWFDGEGWNSDIDALKQILR